MVLCNDYLLCPLKRNSIAELITMKRTEFSKVAKKAETKLLTDKFQFAHDVGEFWKFCTIYCRREKTSGLDALPQEMLDHGVNPYFRDGT